MAKCENCYHFHMCDLQYRLEEHQDCKHYKDKSLIVENVVRCKDCKNYTDNIHDKTLRDGLCRKGNFALRLPNDYCSKGQRKENNDERKTD